MRLFVPSRPATVALGLFLGLATTAPGATQASDSLTLTASRSGGNLARRRSRES